MKIPRFKIAPTLPTLSFDGVVVEGSNVIPLVKSSHRVVNDVVVNAVAEGDNDDVILMERDLVTQPAWSMTKSDFVTILSMASLRMTPDDEFIAGHGTGWRLIFDRSQITRDNSAIKMMTILPAAITTSIYSGATLSESYSLSSLSSSTFSFFIAAALNSSNESIRSKAKEILASKAEISMDSPVRVHVDPNAVDTINEIAEELESNEQFRNRSRLSIISGMSSTFDEDNRDASVPMGTVASLALAVLGDEDAARIFSQTVFVINGLSETLSLLMSEKNVPAVGILIPLWSAGRLLGTDVTKEKMLEAVPLSVLSAFPMESWNKSVSSILKTIEEISTSDPVSPVGAGPDRTLTEPDDISCAIIATSSYCAHFAKSEDASEDVDNDFDHAIVQSMGLFQLGEMLLHTPGDFS